MSTASKVRVAFYGCGNFAKNTRIPNLLQQDSVNIVAVCDSNVKTAQETAQYFNIPHVYHSENGGAHEMLKTQDFDVLYSIVPAYVRTDVEATAAKKGIHIFSEKPQAITMQVANRIDKAIRQAGVISTVGFRERYRPIFQKAREFLADKKVVHVRFQSYGGLPAAAGSETKTWWADMDKSGGRALDWGVHATDYSRFMTGLNVVKAQAFYCERSDYATPLSCSFNYCFNNGGTMTLSFVSAGPSPKDEPWFTVFYEGGHLTIYRYDKIEVNGEEIFQAEEFNPWLEQDKTFIRAVQTGDASILQSDYHDGLFSLAPVLAGWESARRNGECIDLDSFMDVS
ncbi:MAG: Gfo/Idh/MocA family oxidoreductase [Candidatus Poribacteria bacterium]|nr:Gfo/Idh/MocA family oxidoreductase [Candidatus Poribacteria bacterium]